uniref:Myosin light chain (Fragments) n=1 Tax=Penaeus monodon TaxID=6687 RepID=MYL_PENMO|nr:RecName: Full=Myosin light chain [Penaeus monodon]
EGFQLMDRGTFDEIGR